MPDTRPTLYLLCGKPAAGKSTLAKKLAKEYGAVLLSEDDWLAALFADQMVDLKDFVRCSGQLRAVLGPHVSELLKQGVSVVLDFQANTLASRQWMRGVLDGTSAANQLHVLDPPDEICIARLQARNAEGDHPFAATQAQFHQVARHFQRPSEDEGFVVIRHRVAYD